MKMIYKYLITPGVNEFGLPTGCKILSVQTQNNKPQIWVLFDPTVKTKVTRKYQAFPTGSPIEEELVGFIGTFQLDDGIFVYHLFEVG